VPWSGALSAPVSIGASPLPLHDSNSNRNGCSSEASFAYFMYQTKIPLDIIWISRQHQVVEISANTPPCPSKSASACPSYGGNKKAQFVLEVNAGIAAANGLKIGDFLDF